MSIMPGAVWRPITIPGGNPGARTPGRGVVLHVAASEATSLFGFFNNNANANSHFYVAKNGTIEQYVDTAHQAWASMAANKNTISVETQGGVTSPDAEPWTAAQVAALGRICAWAHATEGIPLTPMPNSLPTSRGIGYHRLGINPWRVTGGEVWSSSTGKVCPGTAKIAQIPAVIQAATTPGGSDMPTPDDLFNAPLFTDSPGTPQAQVIRLRDFFLEMRTEQKALFDAVFKGGTSMADGGKSISQSLADIKSALGALTPEAIAAAIGQLPAADAQQIASLVLAGIAAKMNTPA